MQPQDLARTLLGDAGSLADLGQRETLDEPQAEHLEVALTGDADVSTRYRRQREPMLLERQTISYSSAALKRLRRIRSVAGRATSCSTSVIPAASRRARAAGLRPSSETCMAAPAQEARRSSWMWRTAARLANTCPSEVRWISPERCSGQT